MIGVMLTPAPKGYIRMNDSVTKEMLKTVLLNQALIMEALWFIHMLPNGLRDRLQKRSQSIEGILLESDKK